MMWKTELLVFRVGVDIYPGATEMARQSNIAGRKASGPGWRAG
jgi:hypothetical protein